MKKLVTTFLCYMLIMAPLVRAQDSAQDWNWENQSSNDDVSEKNIEDIKDAQDFVRTDLDKSGDWVDGAHDVLNKRVSKLLLKRLGTPGFMVSKYMNIRKLMNQPLCNLSEKLSWGGNMLNVAGDISSHVLKYVQERKLKKEFKEDKELIDKYMERNSVLSRDSLDDEDKDVPLEKLDIHLLSLDYLHKLEKNNLKYKQFRRNFTFPAKGMHLAANIINAQELLAEAGSVGTRHIADQKCRLAYMKKKLGTDQKVAAIQEKMNNRPESLKDINNEEDSEKSAVDSAPFYIKPFLWIANQVGEGLSWLKDSKVGKAIKEYGRQEKTPEKAQGLVDSGSATNISGGFDQAYSTGYIENALVSVVDRIRSKTNTGSGEVKALVKLGSRMATRYAVRAAVKGNEEAVDKFMRSAAGRTAVYTYNIIITGYDMKQEQDSIKYSKIKIKKIKELKEKVSSQAMTLNDSELEQFFTQFTYELFKLFVNEAHARGNLAEEDKILFCLGSSDCSNKFILFDANVKNHLFSQQKSMQKKQVKFVKESHLISTFSKIANGKASITAFNQRKLSAEIKQYENMNNQLLKELDKRNILKKEKLSSFIEFTDKKNTKVLNKFLPKGFDLAKLNIKSKPYSFFDNEDTNQISLKKIANNIKVKELKKSGSQISFVTEDMLEDDLELSQNMNKNYKYSKNFHGKNISIWRAISTRYMKNYSKLKTLPQ